MNIMKGEVEYGAYVYIINRSIFTDGDSWADLKDNILEAVNLFFVDENWVYTIEEIKLKPDLQSFFKNMQTLSTSKWDGGSAEDLVKILHSIEARTKHCWPTEPPERSHTDECVCWWC